MVALSISALVLVAVLPQLVVGIRSTATANRVTEVKGVLQGQVERMNNLPFHVAPSAERRIDVLDTYFPNLTAPTVSTVTCPTGGVEVRPADTWTGYVAATAVAGQRCTAYEPASGAFYRKVESTTGLDGRYYTIVSDTQFLDSSSSTSPYGPTRLVPAVGYNSQTDGSDKPASTEIGVTITVFYRNQGTIKRVSSYTQVAEALRASVRVEAKANATAVDIGSTTTDDRSVWVRAGIANTEGALSSTSTVSASLAAISARLGTADASGLFVGPVTGPPVTTAQQSSGGSLTTSPDCSLSCWGSVRVEPVDANTTGGLPTVTGSAGGAAEARGNGATLTLGGAASGLLGAPRSDLLLATDQPLVSLATTPSVTTNVCGASLGGNVTGRNLVRTTTSTVTSCAETAAAPVTLFRTSFAPAGVLRIKLGYAAASCSYNGTTRTASYKYSATVEYADPTSGTGYTTVTLTGDSSTGSVPAADGLPSLSRSVGGGKTLGDYIASWSSPTTSTLTAPTASTSGAEASLPGVVKLLSQPIRTRGDSDPADALGDPSSSVSLTLGAVGCFSQDAR